MKDHFSVKLGLHFYAFIPLMKDHLSYKTTYRGPMEVLNHKFHCICYFLFLNASAF